MPKLADPDPHHWPRIITRTDALRAGLTADAIRQRVRSGRWRALGRGIYDREPELVPMDRFEAARARTRSEAYAAAMRHPGSVVGLESAAILHGYPLVHRPPDRATLLSSIGKRRADAAAHVHRRALREDEVMQLEPGLWVTTPLRTWIDVTRRGHLADSLSVGDQALRTGGMDLASAQFEAARTRGRHCRLVRRAAHIINGSRETALESFSFARFIEWELPLPRLQAEIIDDGGLFVARVDFLWDEAGVIGEADGALKYHDHAAHYAEKRREDALRSLGFTVVRWGWSDLWDQRRVRLQLSRALGSYSPGPRVRPAAS